MRQQRLLGRRVRKEGALTPQGNGGAAVGAESAARELSERALYAPAHEKDIRTLRAYTHVLDATRLLRMRALQ